MISEQYIKEFLEKKERKNPLMLKTKYGRALDSRFAINEQKASEWLARRKGQRSYPVGKS